MSLRLFLLILSLLYEINPAVLLENRILGNEFAVLSQFPFQVSVRRNNRHVCGGSILTENFIVTAAHCVIDSSSKKSLPASEFSIFAGTTAIFYGKEYFIERVIINENYEKPFNDIALMKIKGNLKFTKDIQPIEIYDEEIQTHSPIFISGWGKQKNGGSASLFLKYNSVNALSDEECSKLLGFSESNLLCLEHYENNGACNGDSGGPAVLNGKLVGVANFVIQYCGSSFPDIYAKINKYANWIKEKISTN